MLLSPFRAAVSVSHVFFDLGGVLATNGWSSAQRALAMQHFGIEAAMEDRHDAVAHAFETGALALDAYLDAVVFDRPRAFSRDAFWAFVQAQSRLHPDVVAIAQGLRAAHPAVRVWTMNNENEALHVYRVDAFGLAGWMDGFAASCWLGAAKPEALFFRRALGVAGAEAGRSLFFDDRPENVAAARTTGLDAVHFSAGAMPLGVLTGALHARGLAA